MLRGYHSGGAAGLSHLRAAVAPVLTARNKVGFLARTISSRT
nr:MAG TPA: hypothetical protein [Caudoviricetes sp.]